MDPECVQWSYSKEAGLVWDVRVVNLCFIYSVVQNH